MKIFLVSPNEKDFLYNAGDRPPLGLMYISTALEKKGVENYIFDLNHFERKKLIERIINEKPDYVGISIPSSPSFERMKDFGNEIKGYSKLIFGGPHVSAMPESLTEIADSIIIGYGERGIIKTIEGRRGIINEPTNFEEFQKPNRKKINPKDYSMDIKGLRGTTMITSRGCPFDCVFCASHERKVQFRDLESIKEELDEIKEEDYKAVYLLDENFLNDRKIFEKMTLFYEAGINYKIEGRADNIREDICKQLKKTGCIEISVGIESGDDQILKNANKKTTTEMNRNAIKLLGKYGIDVKGFFIFGLPGETEETAKKTMDFAEEMRKEGLTSADFYCLTPFPGSEIWNNPDKYGIKILSRNFNEYLQKGKPIIETERLKKDKLEELLIRAKEKWKD